MIEGASISASHLATLTPSLQQKLGVVVMPFSPIWSIIGARSLRVTSICYARFRTIVPPKHRAALIQHICRTSPLPVKCSQLVPVKSKPIARRSSMFRRHMPWLALVVLLVIAAACLSSNPQQQAPPTATGGSQSAPPTNTLPPAAPTDVPTQPQPTEVAPTVEPSQPTETSAPTATLTQTPKPRATAATVRPRNTATPLNVNYEVVQVIRRPGDEATLILKVYVTGGSGGYRYYHDDIQQPGATFNIPGHCGKPFVHTLKVISGDGQSVAVPYHASGICPTPTP